MGSILPLEGQEARAKGPHSGGLGTGCMISWQQLRYRSTAIQLYPDYWLRPFCTRNAFDLKWNEPLTSFQLDLPTSTTHPRAVAVVWPLDSWIRYPFSRVALIRQVDKSFPLTCLARGDAHLVAGSWWTQTTILLVNMGWLCRSTSGVWALGLAKCDDNQMPTVGFLWKPLFEVRHTATQWLL